MLSIKNWLNKYFGFTKREFNALLTLSVILILITVLPYFYQNLYNDKVVPSTADLKAIYQLQLIKQQEKTNYYQVRNQIEDAAEATIKTTLFKFDPNTTTIEGWQKLGLSPKQAQSIVNYVNKGGKFYQPTDLQKMYTISAEKYQQLLPYIAIAPINSERRTTYPKTIYPKKEIVVVEINAADTTQLDQIKGIGAAFARRIVNYREKLGGFYQPEQLMEVYGLDSLKYAEIKNQITIDASKVRQININTAQFDELKNHPYLKYKQINAIIQYRKQHGKFTSIADLKKVAILNLQIIDKLTPYLSF